MIDNNMDFIAIFEQKIAKYTGFKYAVCVDCCTNGIIIALEMLNRLNEVDKCEILQIPSQTYMSIPMTLKIHGWNIQLVDIKWEKSYRIGNTCVFDAATDFKKDLIYDFPEKNSIVCVSFQQKKRLSLGRGGAILLDDEYKYKLLKRMVHDGRNSHITQFSEVNINPEDIILGYHCYLEPDKAAKGILKLNQPLPEYKIHTYKEYPDLKKLNIIW